MLGSSFVWLNWECTCACTRFQVSLMKNSNMFSRNVFRFMNEKKNATILLMPRMGNIKLSWNRKHRVRGKIDTSIWFDESLLFSQVSSAATYTAMARIIRKSDIWEKFIWMIEISRFWGGVTNKCTLTPQLSTICWRQSYSLQKEFCEVLQWKVVFRRDMIFVYSVQLFKVIGGVCHLSKIRLVFLVSMLKGFFGWFGFYWGFFGWFCLAFCWIDLGFFGFFYYQHIWNFIFKSSWTKGVSPREKFGSGCLSNQCCFSN